jgi:hypothetical protein
MKRHKYSGSPKTNVFLGKPYSTDHYLLSPRPKTYKSCES